ncbi:MAG: EscR/YscR/HrcR family type III secretion system export apparatus protein, partial [Candidatus Didemnitutus sp.]|nr:EscR/YscR/HrcR family type III secretion system export apparatus protein [Candidatus Didemnitutus sp.]
MVLLLGVAPAAFAQEAATVPPPTAATAVETPAATPPVAAAPADPLRLSINLEGTNGPAQMSVAVQIVILMTLLS